MRTLTFILIAAAGQTLADTETPAPHAQRTSLLSPVAPIWQPETDDDPMTQPPATEPAFNAAMDRPTGFGVRGSRRFTAGIRGAQDFEDNTDTSLFAQQTWFVVDDVEIGIEAAAWFIFQEDDTWGLSSSLVTRYHFFQGRKSSYFVEAGMGLFIAADNVPDEGTSFGLMPRVGIGATFLLDDLDTRLIVGAHWHHISNARLNGEARNPARDAVGFYVGVSVPI